MWLAALEEVGIVGLFCLTNVPSSPSPSRTLHLEQNITVVILKWTLLNARPCMAPVCLSRAK